MLQHLAAALGDPAPWWAAFTFTGGVAWAAWRSGSLRPDGAMAALAVGVVALRVQWAWGVYLIGWFALASILSRIGRTRKVARTREVVLKDDRRDAKQVLANGGVFALCAVATLLTDGIAEPSLAIAAAGALVASGADTWSTEIGTLLGGNPRSLRSGERVAPGTSGAVTWSGTLGGVAGAVLLSGMAFSVSMITAPMVWPVALAGITGALADTLAGAWGQDRRWCPVCRQATERHTHCDGVATEHRGGMRWLDNDLVNVVCSLVGALVAVALTGALTTRGIGMP